MLKEGRGNEVEQAENEKKLGLQGEEIVANFLKEAFPGLITNFERTSTYGKDDMRGVDYICKIGDSGPLAVDLTFDSDKRREWKMQRALLNPTVLLHDEKGKAKGDYIPRVLLYERSTALWLAYQTKAQSESVKLIRAIDKKTLAEQKKRFIQTVLDQADGLAAQNEEYRKKIAPIRKKFQQALADLEKDN